MKKLVFAIVGVFACVGVVFATDCADLTGLVNPFVGTLRLGSSHPGATWPGGMLQPGPDVGTRWPVRSGYHYNESKLAGFSQNRQMGTEWACLHDVLMLPFTGDVPMGASALEERHLFGEMDKASERAEPGYYAVRLSNFGVNVELTVSRRVAYHRYTFEKGGLSRVLVDLQSGPLSSWGGERAKPPRVVSSGSRIGADGVLTGTNVVKCALPARVVAFAVAFSRPWKAVSELGDNGWPGKRYVFDFDLKPGESVVAKVALSTVDEEGARRNMKSDPKGFDFDACCKEARLAWERILRLVEVDGDIERRKVFYTMLYQSFVHPNIISDVDGQVRLCDGKVHKMDKPFFTGYLDTWDTFRALHPLVTVIAPRHALALAQALLDDARCRGGTIPSCHIWGQSTGIMPGCHGIPIVLDALEKGLLVDYDPAEIVCVANRSIRPGARELSERGWYPLLSKRGQTVSSQLDDVTDCWCVARAAERHGVSADDVAMAVRAASSWTNIYDVATGFMRPRDEEGRWVEPFDKWQQKYDGKNPWGFNEGGYAQWAWHVLGEPEKLIAMHGGAAKAAADLDAIFNAPETIVGQKIGYGCTGQIGQYFHGNEPTHHMAYLYGYMGRSDRTAELVRDICTKLYRNAPDGMCGDGDSGQMAAWYVLSSFGFYQVKPVGGEFVLGAPQYPRLKLYLENGRALEIVAKNFSEKNRHVSEVSLNGRRIEDGIITYRQLMQGGRLVFSMVGTPADQLKVKLIVVGDSPNYYWAWTYPWLNHGGWNGDMRNVVECGGRFLPKPLDEVKLECGYQKCSGGRRAILNYADLASLVGTWHSDRYYKVNRAGMTAVVKKQWSEFRGVMVFNWHMDHPYCTNGFGAASYRFKSGGENRNVILQILDGTGEPCGTGEISGKTARTPFANPREWYMSSLKDVADFFNGLVDEKTGKKIPVILRYPHEMDGNWFWWGRGWCSADEFRRFCRMEADYLRKACPGQILFAYTPDRTWKDFGSEGDTNNTFLAYYPGDKYVDIIGIDDYSIGHGDDEKAEAALAETIRKLRLMCDFAKPRGQVVCISESGGQKKRTDFWTYLHRVATAEGVNCAFVNTWAGTWGTMPETSEEAENQKTFAANPAVLMEGAR